MQGGAFSLAPGGPDVSSRRVPAHSATSVLRHAGQLEPSAPARQWLNISRQGRDPERTTAVATRKPFTIDNTKTWNMECERAYDRGFRVRRV